MEEQKKNPETLGGLCSHMLSSPMPTSDDPRDALYGMIQKAARGDTSAAKFIKEINGEGPSLDENGITDLRSLSDVVLCRLAGFTLEKLMLQ